VLIDANADADTVADRVWAAVRERVLAATGFALDPETHLVGFPSEVVRSIGGHER
jgi:hypothetical protein